MGHSSADPKMNGEEPVDTTNLDRYGRAALPWSRPRDLLAAGPRGPSTTFFLGTVGPNGRPHAAGVGAIWIAGDFYFTSGPGTRKARNLAGNPSCTLSVRLEGIDLVCEGEADRVLDPPTLERAAALYRQGGWPAEVAGAALSAPFSAPGAGPPPWNLYRLTFHTAFGTATVEPHGATRWRFDR
ncbi:MAG: pyridoxamine 5'-phosphate oxidase family protein [Solirubrobacterales bacterium]